MEMKHGYIRQSTGNGQTEQGGIEHEDREQGYRKRGHTGTQYGKMDHGWTKHGKIEYVL